MKRKLIIAAVLVAMTIGGGTAVLAGHGPKGDCGKGPGTGTKMESGRFYTRMAKALKLTDGQQSQIKSLLSTEQVLADPLRDKMHENRKLLRQAGETATFDEAAVRSLAASVSQIETELTVIRVKTHSQINALLTADQRELVKSLRPDREQHNCQNSVGSWE